MQDEGSFGAAYTFMSEKGIHVLFSDNKGHGLFEVGFPMTIPEECWNTGTDTSDSCRLQQYRKCAVAPEHR